MFGTLSSRWGSFAKIGSPLFVFRGAMTQQLLPIPDRVSKRYRPEKSGFEIAISCSVPAGNWFFAVRRLKSFSFGTGGCEQHPLPSSGASQAEYLGAKKSKAFCGNAL